MEVEDYHVIYLTGAQATGKSTLSKYLKERVQPLEIFSYSTLLADWESQKAQQRVTRENLRELSGSIVTPEDVKAVDNLLIDRVKQARRQSHVIIDSHPVTKESYGFRITPFSSENLKALSPTMICVLYAAPEILLRRLELDRQGRQELTLVEASIFLELQGQLAVSYGIITGSGLYYLDTNKPVADIAKEITKRLISKNPQTLVSDVP